MITFSHSAFRHCCTSRGDKYENKSFRYAYFVRVIRDGGFKVALIARLSIIPPHCKCRVFTGTSVAAYIDHITTVITAVFSTCGMNVWVYAAAAFFSLPKQFLTVYLGFALEQSRTGQFVDLETSSSVLISLV